MTSPYVSSGPGSRWQSLRNFEHVPFNDRCEDVIGTRTVQDLVEGLDEMPISSKGRLVGDRIFSRNTYVLDEEYLEVLRCTSLGEPGEVPEDRFSDKMIPGTVYPLRWAVALLFHRYQPKDDRRVVMYDEVKDHDSWGSAVFSSKKTTARVGLQHVFKDIRIDESVAADELTSLLEFIPYIEPAPKHRWGQRLDPKLEAGLKAAMDALGGGK